METPVKLSVMLSSEVVDTIRQLANRRRCYMTEVIRDAIGTERFLRGEMERLKLLLEDENGKLREVRLR